MVDLFPSILPNEDTYSAQTLQEEWDYPVLRTVIAAHDTEQVNGKSTKLEMAHYLSGRYTQSTLDAMRAEAQTEDPDMEKIIAEGVGLSAYE